MTLDQKHKELQRQQDLEQRALDVLKWPPQRIACAKLEDIEKALQEHELKTLASTIYKPELITEITGFGSSSSSQPNASLTRSSPFSTTPSTTTPSTTAPSVTATGSTETKSPFSFAPPSVATEATKPPLAVSLLSSASNVSAPSSANLELGKTPIIVPGSREQAIDEEWCRKQVEVFKTLYERRHKCDLLLAKLHNPSNITDETKKKEIEQSSHRTSLAIQQCLREVEGARRHLQEELDMAIIRGSDPTTFQRALNYFKQFVAA